MPTLPPGPDRSRRTLVLNSAGLFVGQIPGPAEVWGMKRALFLGIP